MTSPDDLLYFIELAHTLNFSRASERIGISQPSLSVAIKRLEQQIGTELFVRRKRGVVLTPAGKRLLSHSKQLLQYWDSIKAAALASHFEVEGQISLGCHPSVALSLLPQFLPQFLKQYPKLEIQLKHDLSRKVVEQVIDLSIDIGIIVNPVKHPDLVLQKLFEDEVTFWQANSANYTAQGSSLDNVAIICDPELLQTQSLLKRIQKLGLKNYRILSSSNLEVIAALTAADTGISILPKTVAQATHPKLKIIPKMPSYADEIYLVYRHENRNIKAIQEIIKKIKTTLII